MPLALAMAMLANPQLRATLGRTFGGLFRGGGGGVNLGRSGALRGQGFLTPEQFGGRTFRPPDVRPPGFRPPGAPVEPVGAPAFSPPISSGLFHPGLYGHQGGGRTEPSFTLPGAGGGSVMIPELARASAGGDVFARGAIERQAGSAERFRDIDLLLELMREQARAAGMPDPFDMAGGSSGGPNLRVF